MSISKKNNGIQKWIFVNAVGWYCRRFWILNNPAQRTLSRYGAKSGGVSAVFFVLPGRKSMMLLHCVNKYNLAIKFLRTM
jgi:hypothetical protein